LKNRVLLNGGVQAGIAIEKPQSHPAGEKSAVRPQTGA